MVSSGQLCPHLGLLHSVLANYVAGTKIYEDEATVLLPGDFSGVQPRTHSAVSLYVL